MCVCVCGVGASEYLSRTFVSKGLAFTDPHRKQASELNVFLADPTPSSFSVAHQGRPHLDVVYIQQCHLSHQLLR